jgi:hypothetical protein
LGNLLKELVATPGKTAMERDPAKPLPDPQLMRLADALENA